MLTPHLENGSGDLCGRSGRMLWRSVEAREVLEVEDAHDSKSLPQNLAKAIEAWPNAGQFNGEAARTVGGMLPPDFSAVPAELSRLQRWVVWKGPKVPYCATAIDSTASVTDPSTWATFHQSQTAFEEGTYLGVGFVLTGDGIVGLDLDKCVHSGEPEPAAMQLLERVGCQYIEVSPSGTGLRGFGYNHGVPIIGTRGQLHGLSVELYATKRYLTVTGRPLLAGPLVPLPGFSELADAVRDSHLQKKTEEDTGNPLSYSVDLLFSSVGIPANTIPKEVGQRHRCLFALARYLRGTMPNATSQELRDVVKRWHAMAAPVIGTKEFAISWKDFLNAWKRVEHPFGSIIGSILTNIDDTVPLSSRFLALGYQKAAQRLVRICAALQAHQGSEPFFLGARTAGDLLGMHFTDAAKILAAFVDDGILTLISKGSGRTASRYRFNT